jgi:hypothetical protein
MPRSPPAVGPGRPPVRGAPARHPVDAAYWGFKLIAWIHTTLGAAAVIPESQAAEEAGTGCRRPGRRRNWASGPALNGSSAVSSSSSACNARRSLAGQLLRRVLPDLRGGLGHRPGGQQPVGPNSSARPAWSRPTFGRAWRCETPSTRSIWINLDQSGSWWPDRPWQLDLLHPNRARLDGAPPLTGCRQDRAGCSTKEVSMTRKSIIDWSEPWDRVAATCA